MLSKIKQNIRLSTTLFLLTFIAVPFYAATELNLPAFSPLGKEIANGRAVYSDNFYWINSDGTIGSTNRGWSRVPKESRNLVYLSMQEAQTSLDEYSITDEERAEQIRKAEEKRQAKRKQQEQEENEAKNLTDYLNKCEGGGF